MALMPLALPTLAALTPADIDVKGPIDRDSKAEVLFGRCSTPDGWNMIRETHDCPVSVRQHETPLHSFAHASFKHEDIERWGVRSGEW